MINEPTPFKGLNISIPAIVSMKARGLIYQESGLSKTLRSWALPRHPALHYSSYVSPHLVLSGG